MTKKRNQIIIDRNGVLRGYLNGIRFRSILFAAGFPAGYSPMPYDSS